MRVNEFIKDDEQLDEILPLIGMAARSVAGMAAKQVGKAVAGAAAKKIGQKVAGMAGGQPQPTTQTPTQPAEPADAQTYADIDRAKDTLIQPGKNVILPTQAGQPQPFKVTKVAGDEVEIQNPDAIKDPSQPNKVIYKKQDLKKSISI